MRLSQPKVGGRRRETVLKTVSGEQINPTTRFSANCGGVCDDSAVESKSELGNVDKFLSALLTNDSQFARLA